MIDSLKVEFEKFKNAGQEPKPEMTKEFDLKEGNVISFSDNVVKESGWSKKDDEEKTFLCRTRGYALCALRSR